MTVDDEYLPTSRLKSDEFNADLTKPNYSESFKNKIGSRRSYYIVLTLLIFIFAALISAVLGLSYVHFTATNQEVKTCTTEDCLRSAVLFIESMNKSTDPCEDFYQFACGNYGTFHRIPKTAISNDRFSEVHDVMLKFIRDFLEKENAQYEPKSVWKTRQLYRSCMATDAMDAAGLKPLAQILKKIGLTYLSSNTRYSSISSILAGMKKNLNINYLFATFIDADTLKSTANRIYLGKPKEGNIFPVHRITEKMKKISSRKIRETLTSEEKVENDDDSENESEKKYLKAFVKYFKSICMEFIHHFNVPRNRLYNIDHVLGDDALNLATFTNDYLNIKEKVYDTDDDLPITMTVDELQTFTDKIAQNISESNKQFIDWKQYLTILFADVSNVSLDFQTDVIELNNIEYFENIFRLMVDTKANVLMIGSWWEAVTTLLPYTTNRMRFVQDRFYNETNGVEHSPSRSLYCANSVNAMMGMAVSHLLVGLEPLDRSKKMVVEMIENIRWAFEKLVKELKWMDETTKQRTLYKAEQMKTFVGFPEFVNDSQELDDYYYDVEISNDYFGNIINYVQRALNYSLRSLRSPNDYTINTWASDPLEVNAFNWIQANAITVPAGILQFPFFGHDLKVLNYGYLGSILGHELTHGFDNTGRKFDHNGNANMWWTNETTREYEKRTDCFVVHYESYSVPFIEEKVNGKFTLDENIADNGGLREALWAYRKYVDDHGEEPKLPGLEEFNNEQIYFLAFANNWCEATTYESLANSLLDEHSPNYIRVVAGLTNSEEFSNVWKCKKGTRMNPSREKCKIW